MKLPSILLALPLLGAAPAAAKVTWEVIYDTPPDRPHSVDFRIWDDALNGGGWAVHRHQCNGYDHGGDQQWTFDIAGSVPHYSATIKQEHFWIIKGSGVTYRTDHGTMWWDTGDLQKEEGKDKWRARGTAFD
ncbi:hypothetical protein B0T16DRAFT_462078 [Cercophora newfieldiana]|uniref:Uncharacterized protein n=1 Tax=Cercophora newfieldiana TaxID=92897 RepID=A0AA39XXF3_9PEZI|nr:hypothetical protein B0T16DRAFT_462078 [Cercophora newfieldiana]